jgi:aspartate-semialdehyde dehydrogenase
MPSRSYRFGIVGATGAVGQELIRLLHERNFPVDELVLLASARSAGKQISWQDQSWTIREATPEAFAGLDVAVFSAGASISAGLAPEAVKRGCVVIDNSSHFRMDPAVPLVLPEINAHALERHAGIIANPNCSTAIALMGLWPLHRAFGLKGFVAATYQAVSGTGAQAIKELEDQTRAWAEGRSIAPSVYPHPIAFNVLPQVDKFLDSGYTKEEMKMLNEGRKIMELPSLRVTCTCVRVPVFRAHSIAISAEFERPVDLEKARAAIRAFSGSELCDDPAHAKYPMPIDYSGKEKCGVGRLRKDTFFDNGLSLWVSGDQLWKGAALNAIQIAEVLHQRGKLAVPVPA